ncbi:MAG: bifunctional phosphopantothenoylcysteine decarboxylase/phosphopantothenate--cysteine ligase CoaBC [Nitrospiraceae bacterium]
MSEAAPPAPPPRLQGKRLVLGVTGSIAAYKAVVLLRTLVQEGAEVSVVMTESATRFLSPLTFEILSGRAVTTELFAANQGMQHLRFADQADAIVIAPATANMLARLALGLADDVLSTTALAATCPLIVAPAMDGDMWNHPTVQGHTETLRARGVTLLQPEEGMLASGKIGKGRLPDEMTILSAIEARLCSRQDWAGQRVLVSAGPTQEAIDPVRFISNRSSGKMGYAVAEAARRRGAEVVLVSGPTALRAPAGIEYVPVSTAEEMGKAIVSRLSWSTAVIMAAAVADFRPARPSRDKLKKTGSAWRRLDLEPTEDILETLAKQRGTQMLVGFAAETEDVLEHAQEKLVRKGLDLIVGNNVATAGSGFGSDTNAAILVDRTGGVTRFDAMPKRELADRILDVVQALRQTSPCRPAESPSGAHKRTDA